MLPSTLGRHRGGQGRRGVFIGVQELVAIVLLIVVICSIGSISMRFMSGRSDVPTWLASQQAVQASRLQLLKQIHKYNQQAKQNGLTDQLIHTSDTAVLHPSATSSIVAAMDHSASVGGHERVEAPAARAGVVAAPVAVTGTAADSACSCQDPPNKGWPMPPAAEVEAENPSFVAAVKKYAKNKEIMLSLANGIMMCKNTTICWWNGGNILESFLQIISHNKITNHLIGVLDDETENYLKGKQGVNYFRVNIAIPASQAKSHPANKVSTIKYTLLRQIVQLGYNALITDMDLVYMKNPFDHLHRDADVEIQTDGYDDTSYGVIDSVSDPSMGWGGGGLYIRLFTTNVGCMWVKSNARTYTLMSQVADHLEKQAGWDQQVFNEYLLRPSHGAFANSGCSLRVMDYMKWTNSKIFFKSRREAFIPGETATAEEPLMVHFNYHPDKHVRMLCIMDRYFNGNKSACDHFPPGSNPK